MNKLNIGQKVYTGSLIPYQTGVKFYVDTWIVVEFDNNDVWLQPLDKKYVAVIRDVSLVYNNLEELYNNCKNEKIKVHKNRIKSLEDKIEELNKLYNDEKQLYEMIVNHRIENEN